LLAVINRQVALLCLMVVFNLKPLAAQNTHYQKGVLVNKTTGFKIAQVSILNKETGTRSTSDIYGIFSIPSKPGDTIQFKSSDYHSTEFVITDLADEVIFMYPILKEKLPEVKIEATTLKSAIKETQLGYRKQGVFYTGKPHYYYLFLKPMTFIYENFKSEVINARKFNTYASTELAASAVQSRWNKDKIKQIVNIPDSSIENFRLKFMPTLQQINLMSDYDLIVYTRKSYEEYKKALAK
jgi:hypothetical protein